MQLLSNRFSGLLGRCLAGSSSQIFPVFLYTTGGKAYTFTAHIQISGHRSPPRISADVQRDAQQQSDSSAPAAVTDAGCVLVRLGVAQGQQR